MMTMVDCSVASIETHQNHNGNNVNHPPMLLDCFHAVAVPVWIDFDVFEGRTIVFVAAPCMIHGSLLKLHMIFGRNAGLCKSVHNCKQGIQNSFCCELHPGKAESRNNSISIINTMETATKMFSMELLEFKTFERISSFVRSKLTRIFNSADGHKQRTQTPQNGSRVAKMLSKILHPDGQFLPNVCCYLSWVWFGCLCKPC